MNSGEEVEEVGISGTRDTTSTQEQIEHISAALIREYLNRNGLKETLDSFDQHVVRGEHSIKTRGELVKRMHIEKLIKKNKESEEPLDTILDVGVRYIMEKRGCLSPAAAAGNVMVVDVVKQKKSSSASGNSVKENGGKGRPGEHQGVKTVIVENGDALESTAHLHVSKLKTKQAASGVGEGRLTSSSAKNEAKGSGKKKKKSLVSNEVISTSEKGAKMQNKKASLLSKQSTPHSSSLRKKKVTSSSSSSSSTTTTTTTTSATTSSKTSTIAVKQNKEDTQKDPFDLSELTAPLPPRDISLGPSQAQEQRETVSDNKQQTAGLSSVYSSSTTSSLQKEEEKTSFSSSVERQNGQYTGDVLCEDLNDDPDFGEEFSTGDGMNGASFDMGTGAEALSSKRLISPQEIMDLRKLVFGNLTTTFSPEWTKQGFYFSDMYRLEYGLMQLKGGTCGILAAIQALILRYLLFEDSRALKGDAIFTPPASDQRDILTKSLAYAIWKCGGGKIQADGSGSESDDVCCKVVLPSMSSVPKSTISNAQYRPDGISESMDIYTFHTYSSLLQFLSDNLHYFNNEARGMGCILLLYSAILSRTVSKIKRDMDEPSNTLMGQHGYCTQEMVNLLITGKGCSNVFDGNITLDGGSNDASTVLKGISNQSDIGLMSLFEHYDSCKVGSYLKTPKFPIWIVCSESHFTVLFSLNPNLLLDFKAQKVPFDLYYYDQLARQDEQIKLTVNTIEKVPCDNSDKDLISPIEHCIRTKWPNASISWNGTDPLL